MMNRKLVVLVCLLLVCGMIVPTMSVAKKPDKPPGGGGGGPEPPPGTIFFIYNDGTGGALWTMNGDGSSKTKTTTTTGYLDTVSRSKHGGHYWWIGFKDITGETYHDGVQRQEIFALRDDNQEEVQLTNDATLATSEYSWKPVWGHDDSYITWVAKRWVLSGTEWVLGVCGIWRQSISFDSNEDVTGLTGTPDLWWETGYWYSKSQDVYYPIPRAHDVSPDGEKIVYSYLNSLIYIVDTEAGTESQLTGGWGPKWSPDGSKIAYEGSQSIKTISPDGTDDQTLVSVKNNKGWIYDVDDVSWSPDSKYVSYKWWKATFKIPLTYGSHIYIVGADGTGKTCLTNDLGLSSAKANKDWR